MKIFLPFKSELNPFLDEIIKKSNHSWFYGDFRDYDDSYDVVNVHWPEAIFDWREPTEKQLELLKGHVRRWKRKSVLIYTKHDYQRNKGTTANFKKLFGIIEDHSDIFIHLGEFSRNLYREKYPKAQHTVIPHPLYSNSFIFHDKDAARKKLGISERTFVVIVPGTIRTYPERDLVLKTFNRLQVRNKALICTNMRAELRYDFPGRIFLKKIVDIKGKMVKRFKNSYQPPEYYFTYGVQPQDQIELKMSAADMVFIPRFRTLNSGLLFLALTYDKIVIGPSIGNIGEHLHKFGLPNFDPRNRSSVVKALEKGVELTSSHKRYPPSALESFKPESVAGLTDDLIFKSKRK